MSGTPADNAARVPWLERHVKALTAKQLVDLFKRTFFLYCDEKVADLRDPLRRLKQLMIRDRLKRRILFEYKRLELVYNIVVAKLREIAKLPPTRLMDDFHRVLVEMFVGQAYDDALARVRRAIKLAHEFWSQYRLLILSATDPDEARRFRKEGCGRILSLVRRMRRQLELLRRIREEVIKTHVIAEGLPVAVVAGIPSAGKSTLVRKLSTAEPEVADYPFTTKTIIVGKVAYRELRFYLVDTPGLLERPIEKLNEIERKALAALMTLPDIIVFLFDPTAGSYVDVDGQLSLYRSVRRLAEERGVDVIPVVNKIDAADGPRLKAIESSLEVKPLRVSALHGLNLDKLLEELYKRLKPRVGA